MIKTLFGTLLMLLCVYLGKYFADKLKKTTGTLRDLNDFNEKMIESVSFYKDDVDKVIRSTDYKSELKKFFSQGYPDKKYIFKSLDKTSGEYLEKYFAYLG